MTHLVSARARPRRPSSLSIVCLVAIAGLTACTGGAQEPGRAVLPAGFQADVAHYVLPLDSYLPNDEQDSFARNLLSQQCMQAASIRWPIPGLSSTTWPPTYSAIGRPLFNVSFAKKYGYHGYHGGPFVPFKDPLAGRTFTASEERQMTACSKQANDRIGAMMDVRELIETLRNAARVSTFQSAVFLDLSAKWRTCLLAAGVADVPATPHGKPTVADRKRWFGSNTEKSSGQVPMVGGPEEIKVATADAICQESSGYTAGSYQAEVDAQVVLMGQNRGALERAKANTEAAAAVIDEVIKTMHG